MPHVPGKLIIALLRVTPKDPHWGLQEPGMGVFVLVAVGFWIRQQLISITRCYITVPRDNNASLWLRNVCVGLLSIKLWSWGRLMARSDHAREFQGK